jgi:2-(1,2-epoxy-1,2-dihydrophenyl)acetyl-CoA isomerase
MHPGWDAVPGSLKTKENRMTTLVTSRKDQGVATILLNRPEAFNAFNLEMVEGLADTLTALAVEQDVQAVIISGAGKAFCAGGDLKWVSAFPHGAPAGFHALAARFHQAILEIRRMPKPVIAAINGVAAGGGFSLALACDFRVLSESAILRQAYTSNGLSIDGGGSFILPRLVGLARALEIMAFDRPISPEQALSWGLVTNIAKSGDTLQEATSMAQQLLSGSLSSFGWSKKLLTDSFQTPFEKQIEDERRGLRICAAHPEGKEGLQAFNERRKPQFKTCRKK